MNPSIKRCAFPLSAPRWQTYAFWPCHVYAAAVHGYYEAFMRVYDASRFAGPACGCPPADGLRTVYRP